MGHKVAQPIVWGVCPYLAKEIAHCTAFGGKDGSIDEGARNKKTKLATIAVTRRRFVAGGGEQIEH